MISPRVIHLKDHRPEPKPDRNFIATMRRCSQRHDDKGKRTVRHHLNLDNAVTMTSRWAMQTGRPGDMIVIHHNLTGLELGTVRVHATGHLTVKWRHLE